MISRRKKIVNPRIRILLVLIVLWLSNDACDTTAEDACRNPEYCDAIYVGDDD